MAVKRATGFGERTTNYRNVLIEALPAAGDTSRVPPTAGSVAELQYRLIADKPYTMTSDDLLFGAFAEKNRIAAADLAAARERFFSTPKSCMRASPLVKTHGWGIHHDGDGRVALIAQDDPRYAALTNDPGVSVIRSQPRG